MTSDDDSDVSSNEDNTVMQEPSLRLKNLDEVISCLGDVCDFLETRGFSKEANSSNSLLDDLARLCYSPLIMKQTSVTGFV